MRFRDSFYYGAGIRCYIDMDQNGLWDADDFETFEQIFILENPLADCDGNGSFDIADFVCFQNYYSAGCQ